MAAAFSAIGALAIARLFSSPLARDAESRKPSRIKSQASFKQLIATLALPASTSDPAETYHQNYYKKNPVRQRFYRLNCGRDARLSKCGARVGQGET